MAVLFLGARVYCPLWAIRIAITVHVALCGLPAFAQPDIANRIIPPKHIQVLLDAGDDRRAEQVLQDELRQAEGWHEGHLLLAQIYSRRGQFALAERSAAAAVGVRETFDGLMILAEAAMKLGKLNDSIGWLERAAGRWPDQPGIYRLLGLNYALGEMPADSEKAFRRAVTLAPQNGELHYLHGRALYETADFQAARRALSRAIELDPSSIRAWTALGQVHERFPDFTTAEQCYRRALSICPAPGRECAWPLFQLGLVRMRREGGRQAVPYYRQAIAARPDWAKPHFYLGKALAALGDLQGARTEIETAAQLDAARSEYYYQLAQIHQRLGDVQKARHYIARYQALSDTERPGKGRLVNGPPEQPPEQPQEQPQEQP